MTERQDLSYRTYGPKGADLFNGQLGDGVMPEGSRFLSLNLRGDEFFVNILEESRIFGGEI